MAGNYRIAVGDPWWFYDGSIILKAFDSKKIRQVIRYRLFPDDGYPRMCLLERNKAFLTGLLGLEGHQSPENLTPEQMVDEIFLQCITPFRPAPWHWSPTPVSSQDAVSIAEAIESQSHYQLKTIPFAEIVRLSFGYKTEATEWFLSQHTALCEIITNHLRHYPEEIHLYKGVEEVRFTIHPVILSINLIEMLSRSYDLKVHLPIELLSKAYFVCDQKTSTTTYPQLRPHLILYHGLSNACFFKTLGIFELLGI